MHFVLDYLNKTAQILGVQRDRALHLIAPEGGRVRKAIYVRVRPEVEQHLRETAQRERRSLSFVAAELLEEKLAAYGKLSSGDEQRPP